MGNDPVNWVDPYGLKPGDPFHTMDDAAKDAVDYIISTRPQGNRDPEWGGWIYSIKDPSGDMLFSYTEPVSGKRNSIAPSTFNEPCSENRKVAVYHTHPGTGYNVGRFFSDNYWWSALNHYPIYMGTKTGLLMKYKPNNFTDKGPEEITIREHY